MTQFEQVAEFTLALLFPTSTNVPLMDPVTAKVQAAPGFKFTLPLTEDDEISALPATVMVRPANPLKEEGDPPEMTKLPEETVVRFWPLRFSEPADWVKLRQVRG